MNPSSLTEVCQLCGFDSMFVYYDEDAGMFLCYSAHSCNRRQRLNRINEFYVKMEALGANTKP